MRCHSCNAEFEHAEYGGMGCGANQHEKYIFAQNNCLKCYKNMPIGDTNAFRKVDLC
jgi:hypothetical protein